MQVYVNGVPQQSSHVQMAWEWVTFLTTQGELLGTALPAVQAQAEDGAARQVLGSDLYTAYMTALERDVVVPSDRETMIVKDIATLWFDKALWAADSEGLESALEQAQTSAEQFVGCVSIADAIDIQALATCAQQIDPEHPLSRMVSPQN
jgi:hypothetical protein